ncbi:Flp family type IVb pilin [bacterium]|nr:Flp family type IVb pilin [bacterium]
MGQGLTEYLILLVLISLVSIAAVRSLGSTIQGKLTLVRNHIEKVSIEK